MPVYDYLCSACDHRADILHGINDPGPRFCPSCGAEATMRKQFAAPADPLQGDGLGEEGPWRLGRQHEGLRQVRGERRRQGVGAGWQRHVVLDAVVSDEVVDAVGLHQAVHRPPNLPKPSTSSD